MAGAGTLRAGMGSCGRETSWERGAVPLLRRIFLTAVGAELLALDSEVEHLDQPSGRRGRRPAGDGSGDLFWLMHRSCSLGCPRRATWGCGAEPVDLASFNRRCRLHQEPYVQVTSLGPGERGVNWEDPLCGNSTEPR
jgi:hypothetical protein